MIQDSVCGSEFETYADSGNLGPVQSVIRCFVQWIPLSMDSRVRSSEPVVHTSPEVRFRSLLE
jgi:hypothetical protein